MLRERLLGIGKILVSLLYFFLLSHSLKVIWCLGLISCLFLACRYGYVTPSDVQDLLDVHIGKGEIIEKLWRYFKFYLL